MNKNNYLDNINSKMDTLLNSNFNRLNFFKILRINYERAMNSKEQSKGLLII